MELKELIQNIYDYYNEFYDSKIRNIHIGEAFVEVAAYFLKQRYYVESIDYAPPKGINLIVKFEKSGNKCAVQVAEHIKSEKDIDEKTLEEFIKASEQCDIARRMLILFDCPLSGQEIKDFLITDEIGEVITEVDIDKKNIDWQYCWKTIKSDLIYSFLRHS